MKHIKNFKQYEDILNEGIIIDSILNYSGKLKNYFIKKLNGLEPDKLGELRSDFAPYIGKSFNEIRVIIQAKLQPALEKKLNEDSEPISTPNPLLFIAKLGVGTLAASFLTGGINWLTTHWPSILGGAGVGIGDKGLGILATVGLISLTVSVFAGVIGLSREDTKK